MNNSKIFSRYTHLTYLSQTLAISLLLPTTLVHADGTVACNVGLGSQSTECGVSSSAAHQSSTAIGDSAIANDSYATAIGTIVTAERASVAVGNGSYAGGNNSTALGTSAKAHSRGKISIGYTAGYNGNNPVTDSPQSIAIGMWSNIEDASPGAIAIGGDADSNNQGAEAAAPGAIALGADVYNNVPNSMLINVPLRIEGANPPMNALYLTPNTIAIGTATPAKTVHIVKSDGTATMRIEENSSTVQKRYQMQLENNGPTGFKFTDNANGNVWQFSQTNGGGFGFANTANGGQDFVINSDGRVLMGPGPVTNFNLAPDGDLDIPNGSVTATTFNSTSSRTSKTDFTKIDADKIMANIKAMEVTEWRYKDEKTKGRHIGPMAEDFYAMFGLGPDDKHVAATDMASIALIAAKELQKKSDNMSLETAALKAKNASLLKKLKRQEMQLTAKNNILQERLSSLEKLVMNLASSQSLLPADSINIVLNR